MSIALVVRPPGVDIRESKMVPLATEEVFRQFWLPACKELGLQFVPLFETGLPIRQDDFEDILDELKSIRSWAGGLPEEDSKFVRFRVDAVLDGLQEAMLVQGADVYIG